VRALYFEDYGRMALREVADPRPGPGEVVVRVAACGICGSDLEGYLATPGMRARRVPPLLLGHEFAGVVEEGPPEWVGSRVAVNPLVSCGLCARCREGKSHLCPKRQLIGLNRPGAFAERVVVPLQQLHPLPPGLPVWKGALAEPLAVALHAVNLANPPLGTRALVIGGGAIGILLALTLTWIGTQVLVLEPREKRRDLLRELGIEAEETAEGAWPLTFDAVGSEDTRRLGLSLLEEGGTLVLLGLHENISSLAFYPVVLGERQIQGSYTYTDGDFRKALELAPKIPQSLVEMRSLAEGAEAFRELAEGMAGRPKVLLIP
jgi:2-desacetyl-2-hydroxyethyl bacteriochlorophyllide A dehydrogenase